MNVMRVFLLLLLVLFLSDRTYAVVPDDEEDPYFILMGEADKAIADGDYGTAALRLREAMNYDPENPSNVLLLSNLGMVYSRMDMDSLAIMTLDEALRRAPAMVTVIENRGRLHLKCGHNAEAYADFSSVLERDSLNVSARYFHGMMSLYGGRLDVATEDFEVLESVDPQGYNTAVAMGALYSLTARPRQAIPYYKRLVEEDPSPEYYSALAGCYLELEDLTEASAVIEEGLKRYAFDPELYYYRAWLNRDRYRMDDARRDAEKAIKLGADPKKVKQLFGN